MTLAVTAETIERLLALVAVLEQRNAVLEAENAQLRARVAELERRLGLDSTTSSKPPSSDGPAGPVRRTRSLRERGGRKPEGQPGHPGRTLKQVALADAVLTHRPALCAGGGRPRPAVPGVRAGRRQVFDLPEPAPLRGSEHRVYRCTCPGCGQVSAAPFPAAVRAPVQYGPRLGALVAYLSGAQFLPEARLRQVLADVLGLRLSAGTLGRMVRQAAARAQDFAAAVRARICKAPVKHLDETGLRVGARPYWLHVAGTAGPEGLVHYRVAARRGAMLDGAERIVVHDHWTSYFQMPGVTHALCNAHHLRELTAVAEIDGEAWALRMRRLLRRLCHRVQQALDQARAIPPPLIASLIDLAERLYDRIVQAGLAWHAALAPLPRAVKRGRIRRRVGHNLALRLHQHKAAVLLFLHEPAVPFTNNEAERDARMIKLRQKISGGFRTLAGAQDFATLRTLIGTARKRGWDILAVLALEPAQLIAHLAADRR